MNERGTIVLRSHSSTATWLLRPRGRGPVVGRKKNLFGVMGREKYNVDGQGLRSWGGQGGSTETKIIGIFSSAIHSDSWPFKFIILVTTRSNFSCGWPAVGQPLAWLGLPTYRVRALQRGIHPIQNGRAPDLRGPQGGPRGAKGGP
jgi:hypothetical protein